jgi:glutamine amidotransferase
MSAPEVTLIDYGVGNLLSVQRGLEHCGAKVTLTADLEQILAAKRVVLPGVGAFANAMQALERKGLLAVIREIVRCQIPLLGICLGMQLLLEESEEFGVTAGLGLIPGRVIPIPSFAVNGEPLKTPHIGWNELIPRSSSNWTGSCLEGHRAEEAMYFVHSFMAVPSDPTLRLADCSYGGHQIAAVIKQKNIIGCQFHPEKSGKCGLAFLRRFLH